MRKLLFVLCACALAACNEVADVPTRRQPIAASTHALTGVDADRTMGVYSAFARAIAIGLRDSATRMAVMRALKSETSTVLGIDLQACNTDGPVKNLLQASERIGGVSANATCATIASFARGVLYMDRDRLRVWNGTTIPIVTAIQNPAQPLPAFFHGYLSSERTIDLPADGSLKGPILVVLPFVHPTHNSFARQRGTDFIRTVVPPRGDSITTHLIQPAVSR